MPTPRRRGTRSTSPERYRRITFLALLALCGIVITGGAVRLTGSGLGCSDWPVCETDQPVPALDFHAWIEFGNRLITGVVAAAVIAAVLGSRRRVPRRRDLDLLAWGLVAGVLAQVVVGAFTVIWHLPPGIVALHFLLSMVLVGNAYVLHHRAGEDPAGDGSPPAHRRPLLTGTPERLVSFLGVWVWVVMVSGTVVTAAGPHRGDPDVEPLDVHIPSVARIHGLSVVVFMAALVALLFLLRRDDAAPRVERAANTLLVVALAQAAIGYVQYFNDVPVLLVGLHLAGATALFVAVTHLVLSRSEPVAATGSPERPAPATLGS